MGRAVVQALAGHLSLRTTVVLGLTSLIAVAAAASILIYHALATSRATTERVVRTSQAAAAGSSLIKTALDAQAAVTSIFTRKRPLAPKTLARSQTTRQVIKESYPGGYRHVI